MILHASEAHQMGYHRAVVVSKDTDVFVLLIYHETTPEVWMVAGTSKNPHNILIHDVRASLSPDIIAGLLACHAITRCDTTSYLSGIGKRTAFKTLQAYPNLLTDFANGRHSETMLKCL